MTRQHAFIGIIAIVLLSFSNGCRDYPDAGPLTVELQWEIPPSDDAGVSDAEAPEPGTFGECEQAGAVRFKYRLEDMSDCVKYSNRWDCRIIPTYAVYEDTVYDYGEPISCDEIPILVFDWIAGGDYRMQVWGYDEDDTVDDYSWRVTCPDLYVDGSKTDEVYPCDVPYRPRSEKE